MPMAARDAYVLAAICLGGGLGSIARYGMEELAPRGDGFPAGTLFINLSGALLLGTLVGVLAARVLHAGRRVHPLARPFLGTGVLGGYTTFSTFAVEARELSTAQSTVYVVVSAAAGVALALAGLSLGRVLAGGQSSVRPAMPLDPDL